MNIEVSYTGGGVWIAEMDLQDGTFAVVDSDYPLCLSVYNKSNEDEQYMPDNMIFSCEAAQLNDDYVIIYNKLVRALEQRTSKA